MTGQALQTRTRTQTQNCMLLAHPEPCIETSGPHVLVPKKESHKPRPPFGDLSTPRFQGFGSEAAQPAHSAIIKDWSGTKREREERER